MSLVLTDNQHYEDIADAIRSKNGSVNTYKPEQMAQAISNIPTVPSSYTHGYARSTVNINFHLGDISVRAYGVID